MSNFEKKASTDMNVLHRLVKLPVGKDGVAGMSDEEIDVAIAELRKMQEIQYPVRCFDMFAGGFTGFGIGFIYEKPLDNIAQDGFAEDAENLRGDMERVACDMWIGLLHTTKQQRRGRH